MATHVLIVGIDDYPGRQSDLAYCTADAALCSRLFGRRGRGTRRDAVDTCPFFGAADTLAMLTNRQASREAVLRAVTMLMKRLAAGDLGIFCYSGHGSYVSDASGDERDGFDEALVCADGRVIVDDELAVRVEARAAGARLLALMDCCYSGNNLRSPGPRLLGPTSTEHCVRFLSPGRLAESERSRPRAALGRPPKLIDVVWISGCGEEQFSAESPSIGHGAFTYYAAQAICSLRPGADYGDWCTAIGRRLPNDEFDQVPQVNAYARALEWKLPVWKG